MSEHHDNIDNDDVSLLPPNGEKPTRTVAIIKNHALKHRMTIQMRIEEAGFEIIKERQMEFSSEGGDQEYLQDLFGEDTPSLFEGPVRIYILERSCAAEAWNNLMGNRDPAVAREESPSSLRGIYGITTADNALIGSPDAHTAEEQISVLFVSSPPFPPIGYSNDEADYDQVERLAGNDRIPSFSLHNQDMLANLSISDNHRGNSSSLKSNSRSRDGSMSNGGPGNFDLNRRKTTFKARPLPATTAVPSIQPRSTRAAALRAGLPVESTKTITKGPRKAPTKEEQKQVFMDVPGHKRSQTIQVASTAPPAIAPRMTRAASLRIGQPSGGSPVRPKPAKTESILKADVKPKTEGTFEGVPGHKRRETITVASVKPPTVLPRSNRSALLRQQKDSMAPPSAFRAPSYNSGTSALSRPASQNSIVSVGRPPSTVVRGRPSSALAPSRGTSQVNVFPAQTSTPDEAMRPATVRISSTSRRPSILPRSNKSASLRAIAGARAVPVPESNSRPVWV